jgi:hypothetical protein
LIAGNVQEKVIETIFYGIWGAGIAGINPGNVEELAPLLKSNGLNADTLIDYATKPFAKELLKKETDYALQRVSTYTRQNYTGDRVGQFL